MILRIILLLALSAGYLAKAQTTQAKIDKVGYADIEYVISQLPDMKAIEADLKSTQTQLRNQIQAKSQQVQKQYTDFNANSSTMSDTVRMRIQGDIEKEMQNLEQMQQEATRTLQNKQKLHMAPLYLKVNRAISEVAQENGYTIILTQRVSTYDFLLYNSSDRDISGLVLQKFGVTSATDKAKQK